MAMQLMKRSSRGADYQDVPRPIVGLSLDFPAGFVDPRHSHKRAQLFHVVSGMVQLSTDAATFVLPPHRAAWIPAGVAHQARCVGNVSGLTLYIDSAACAGLSDTCRVFDVPALLQALILEAASLPIEYDVGGRDGRVMALILDELAAATSSVPLRVPMPRHPRLLRVCRSILANPNQQLTLDDCARLCNMGRRTFTRLFRQETQTTFIAWRQRVRLMEAYGRLVIGESVARAAADVGYRSPSAFARMFRDAFGVPPTRYLGT
jgi:AraC-like DNA-binding protein/mannose-6-phosphate isomerase-like protein (cupin superfamily)